ncbi:MAG: chromosome segregation SMC family protein [Candidatus Caldarchaeum sp.]|nr:chromosome segregation SMC family protein [Candidatus Caldarchaeum sp.]
MVCIKSITIQGFKSFGKKRTVIKLPRGLVVITGPNGGGKSTVLDAVKFAFGELSAHNLRVDRFSKLLHESSRGTDTQAMVTITLDNSDRSLPVDNDEVVISRHLYVTGESQYFLNGRSVSRNEMLTILAAANIKPDGLNLVTQGSVVGIAEMTGKEVREVLEDAAGISGYKKRRDEALRELETAQKNIDIAKAATAEVRSRVKQLEVERNQLLRKMLVEKTVNGLKSISLVKESNLLKQSLQQLEKRASEIISKIAENQSIAETTRIKVLTAKNELNQLTKKHEEIVSSIREIDRQIFLHESEKARREAEGISAEKSLEQLEFQKKVLRERVEKWRERISEILLRQKAVDAELEKAQSDWTKAEDELSNLRKKADSVRALLEEAEEKYSAKLEELRFLRLNEDGKSLLLENLQKQINRKQMERNEAEKQLAEYRERRDELERRINQINSLAEQISRQLESLVAEKQQVETVVLKKREKISEVQRMVEQSKIIKASLNQLLQTLRTTQLLKNSGKTLKTVREIAGDELDGWKKAVLGDWLNAVVVEDVKTALSLASLASEKKIPLKIVFEFNGVNSLLQSLSCGNQPKPLISVKDVKATDRNVATEDGVYVGSRNIINVYSEQDEQSIADHVYKNLDKVSLLEEKLLNAQELLSKRLKQLEQKAREAEAQVKELTQTLHAKKLEKARLEAELANVSKAVDDLTGRIASIDGEVSKLETERNRLSLLVDEKSDELSALKLLKKQVEERRAELRNLDEAIREKSVHVSVLYKTYLGYERQKDSLNIELRNLSESMSSAEKELQAMAELDEKLRKKIDEIRSSIDALEEKLKRLREEKSMLEKTAAEVTSLITEKSGYLKELEHQLEGLLSTLSGLEKENNNLAIERVRLETSLKSLNERLEGLATVGDDEPELPAELLQRLEIELGEISAVNQLALVQYDGIIENYRLRSTRINELEMERKKILDLIDSINREEAEAFQKALESVSNYFGFYFNQLTGGEGFLRLENPAEPLNSGVEMVVKFLGKPARTTVSISGGEKSVSAVALILALQDLSPAQFYVFDEIDAHLDVVYVKNLVNLLKKMSSKKQIIIITLKDIIAEQADALFGVYMVNESSQVVKTRLTEVVEGHE